MCLPQTGFRWRDLVTSGERYWESYQECQECQTRLLGGFDVLGFSSGLGWKENEEQGQEGNQGLQLNNIYVQFRDMN